LFVDQLLFYFQVILQYFSHQLSNIMK
jgi:hypothetical protein